MIRTFKSVCPPLTLEVKECLITGEWSITVQLSRVPPTQATIHHADEEAAKRTAVAMAHVLCVQYKIDTPNCLDTLQWM